MKPGKTLLWSAWPTFHHLRSVTIALVLLCIAACGCPRYPITEAVSPAPTRRYTAQAYENNCGVLSDKNIILALKETSLYDTDEVMAIFNIYWTVRLEWTAHDRLHVTFECPPDEYGCGIGNRHWIADWKTTWRDVHITYTASPAVLQRLSPADLRLLPFGPDRAQ